MIKKILVLGMMIGAVNIASADPVPFNEWDPECQQIVANIVNSGKYDQENIYVIKQKLSALQGGAYTIYNRLIAEWSTGDDVRDSTPDELVALAETIYSNLEQ